MFSIVVDMIATVSLLLLSEVAWLPRIFERMSQSFDAITKFQQPEFSLSLFSGLRHVALQIPLRSLFSLSLNRFIDPFAL